MAKRKIKQNVMLLVSALSGFVLTILIIMLIFDFKTTQFKTSKLVKYIEDDNNYKEVEKYYNLDIKTTDDGIIIYFKNDEINDSLEGTLDNNILTFKISNSDSNILLKGKLLYSVADSIGQVNGNEKGYVSSVLGSLDYTKITLKDNGIEIYTDTESNEYIYKFSVDKKYSLGSIADIYFDENDFLSVKDKLINDEYVQLTKGNLIFYKITDNNENKQIIYFGEPNDLTTRTYNSLLSLITVMYDSNTSDLFSKASPKLQTITFNNINVITNYEVTDDEVITNKLLDNYKVLKVEISK